MISPLPFSGDSQVLNDKASRVGPAAASGPEVPSLFRIEAVISSPAGPYVEYFLDWDSFFAFCRTHMLAGRTVAAFRRA